MGTLRVRVEGEVEEALDALAAATGSRSNAVRYALLSTYQEALGNETAKIAALRQAAERGWSDLSAGCFADVDDSSLGHFIAKLGARSAGTIHA